MMDHHETCPICGSDRLVGLKDYSFTPDYFTDLNVLPEGTSYQQERLWIFFNHIMEKPTASLLTSTLCQSCSFIFLNPRLTQKDILTKYKAIEILGLDRKRHQREKDLSNVEKRANRIYQTIKEFRPGSEECILDYGGAEGHLLIPFLDSGDKGYLIDYIEYDQFDSRITYLGSDHSDLLQELQFDIILINHTLEHVGDPVQLLIDLAAYLKPGGLFYIEVPLGAWLEWEFLNEPVTHLNFFSDESLVKTVERAGLYTQFIQSQWQWAISGISPCINLIASNEPSRQKIKIVPFEKQMRGHTYILGGLKCNWRYYMKLVVKHFWNRILTSKLDLK